MTVVFIHGANVSDELEHRRQTATRNELIRRWLLDPLGPLFSRINIENPYWGARSRGRHDIAYIRDQEPRTVSGTPESDVMMTQVLRYVTESMHFPSDVSNRNFFKHAAEQDLQRLIDVLLAPILLGEQRLLEDTSPELVGLAEAFLIVGGDELAKDASLQQSLIVAATDDHALDMIKSALQTRVITLIEQGNLLSQPLFQQDDVKQQWLEKLRGRISFLIDHMAEAPIRADKGRVFEQLRAQLHQDLRHYFLDEYTYMGERQNSTRSESITAEVLQALLNAPKGYPNEPLITITHGIGGMILYDILTREQPDLHVDIWISVAPHYTFVESSGQIQRQVAQASTSQPSSSLEAVVGYWLHVADPSDFLSFQTPRFPQSIDEIQLTLPGMGTLKTHNTYFVSAQFYHLVREWIRPRLNLDRSSKQ